MAFEMTLATISCLLLSVSSLSIRNISSPVKLTDTFINPNDGTINLITPGLMTYYIEPSDPSKTKLLWYGMYSFVNESSIASYIESDIFNSQWEQYSNNLPYIIDTANGTLPTNLVQIGFNSMCTSPVNNDILTCWLNITFNNDPLPVYNIYCKLYHSQLYTFSNVIQVTSSTFGFNIFYDVLCFNDSYFIPWSHTNSFDENNVAKVYQYGTLMDLMGNIVQNDINLNVTTGAGSIPIPYATKGSRKFNVSQIKNTATDSFMITVSDYNKITNITNIQSIYGYYTNINDLDPINIYNTSIVNHNFFQNLEIELNPNTLLDWNQNCCYISLYTQYSYNYQYITMYGIITDFKGNNIDIIQYPNFTDIILAINVTDTATTHIIDLPVISSDATHYFMITYGNSSYNDYFETDTIVCSVHGLQYDQLQNQYNMFHAGNFDTVKLVNGSSGNEYFGEFWAYNLPDTNTIFFSWDQSNFEYTVDNLYGQTFEIS